MLCCTFNTETVIWGTVSEIFVSKDTKESITNIWQKKPNKIDSEDVMLAIDPNLYEYFPVFYFYYFKGEIK